MLMNTCEIAELVGGELTGSGDIDISGVAALDRAAVSELAFAERADEAVISGAGCVIVPDDAAGDAFPTMIRIRDPKLAFAKAAAALQPPDIRSGIHPTAVIAADAEVDAGYVGAFVSIGEGTKIGRGTLIFDGSSIGRDVTIGERTTIHPNCVIYDHTVIGSDCVIHAGTVIGAEGFGYVRDDSGEYHQFPQIGVVVIEDRVEIGANSCIDRGALGETRIGEGTKIDNLVQIAHNVSVGKRVVIAAQTGISGSTVIEDDCVIGGQVGMGDHARVLSGAIIGSQAGVLPGKIVRPGVWWGTPVQPLDEYKRQNAMVKGLGRLREEIKELKKKLLSD